MNEKLQEVLTQYQELIGDADLMAKRGFTQKAAEIYAKAEGILLALEVFGYTVEEQYNEALELSELIIKEV